jgi:hypothetical protein
MKVEFAMSILSKRETLLGIQLAQHNGVSVKDGELCSERIMEFSIGIIFAIFTIGFVTLGEKIETPDNVMKAMEAFESEMQKGNNDFEK